MTTYEMRNEIDWMYTESLYDDCIVALESSDKPNIFKRIFDSVREFIQKCIDKVQSFFTKKKLDELQKQINEIKASPEAKKLKVKINNYDKKLKACEKALSEADIAKTVDELQKSKVNWEKALKVAGIIVVSWVSLKIISSVVCVHMLRKTLNDAKIFGTGFDFFDESVTSTRINLSKVGRTLKQGFYENQVFLKVKAKYISEILKMKSKLLTDYVFELSRRISDMNRHISDVNLHISNVNQHIPM